MSSGELASFTPFASFGVNPLSFTFAVWVGDFVVGFAIWVGDFVVDSTTLESREAHLAQQWSLKFCIPQSFSNFFPPFPLDFAQFQSVLILLLCSNSGITVILSSHLSFKFFTVGFVVSCAEGLLEGDRDGDNDCKDDGKLDVIVDGTTEGASLDCDEGLLEGDMDRDNDLKDDGKTDVVVDGTTEGLTLTCDEGLMEGDSPVSVV